MGEFRFRVPGGWELPARIADNVHVVGLDGIPWPCRVSRAEGLMIVTRNRDESGRTYIGYPTQRYGRLLLCTGTLMTGQREYDLVPELARGTLNRLRNQISIWEEGGLKIGDSIRSAVRCATNDLGAALMHTDAAEQNRLADRAIQQAVDAIFELSRTFGSQISSFRRDHPELEAFWIARTCAGDAGVGALKLDPRFDLVQVSPEQAEATASESADVADPGDLIVGPFLDASPGGLPQPLVDCPTFGARRETILNSARARLENLPASTSILHIVSGLNGIGHRQLNYAQQLQVTGDLLGIVDETELSIPTLVSFDFPWAERLAGAVGGIHPLQVADSLLRQGSQVSFLGLDINLDYWPTGSAFRDPLQWIDLIDVWTQLGLPLVICLRMPSAIEVSVKPSPVNGSGMLRTGQEHDDQQRFEILNTVLPMLAARPAVHGLIWRQWSDPDDPRFPFGGLVRADGSEKPVLGILECLRAWI